MPRGCVRVRLIYDNNGNDDNSKDNNGHSSEPLAIQL